MIEIRYSTEAEDVDITGTSIEFQSLHNDLLMMLYQGNSSLYVEASTDFDPAPYDSYLEGIELKKADINEILIHGHSLVVQGNQEFLQSLAINLPRDEEKKSSCSSHHIHYDWISFGQYLSEGSTGLIFNLIC